MEIHKYVKRDAHVETDMTPMIDVVFLLIIFFMLVTELSKLDIEEVVLPIADRAIVEEPQPDTRQVTVNIKLEDSATGRGVIKIGGEEYSEKELIEHLKLEAQVYGRTDPNPNKPGHEDSLLEVLIRGDERVNAGYLHHIYKACSEAKIFKVRLAALNTDLGESRYTTEEPGK